MYIYIHIYVHTCERTRRKQYKQYNIITYLQHPTIEAGPNVVQQHRRHCSSYQCDPPVTINHNQSDLAYNTKRQL